MAKYVIDEKTLTDIANAIRSQKGTNGKISTENFADEIKGILTEGTSYETLKGVIDRSITELHIPTDITTIGFAAFWACVNLTEIVIPDNIITVSAYGFNNCTRVKKLTIGNGVTTIDSYGFCGLLTLDEPITIPNNVKTLGVLAFSGCKSTPKIVVGSGVTSIGNTAFSDCVKCLEFDFSNHTSFPTLGTNVFSGINTNAKIIVPEGLYDTWIKATNWVDWREHIVNTNDEFIVINGLYAKVGMTWREWVSSDYNDGNYYIDGNCIKDHRNDNSGASQYQLYYVDSEGTSNNVHPDDKIINCAAGTEYIVW